MREGFLHSQEIQQSLLPHLYRQDQAGPTEDTTYTHEFCIAHTVDALVCSAECPNYHLQGDQ